MFSHTVLYSGLPDHGPAMFSEMYPYPLPTHTPLNVRPLLLSTSLLGLCLWLKLEAHLPPLHQTTSIPGALFISEILIKIMKLFRNENIQKLRCSCRYYNF